MSAIKVSRLKSGIFGIVALTLIGAPVRAAEADFAYGAPAAGAYQEFDLGSTTNSAAANYSAGVAAGAAAGAIASAAATGNYGNPTVSARRPVQAARRTSTQRLSLAPATTAILDRTFGRLMFLPPTSTDSFVLNSAGNADLIYGDEGSDGPPPFEGFDESHRIERGIYNPGLTTGHRSALPEAWGYPN